MRAVIDKRSLLARQGPTVSAKKNCPRVHVHMLYTTAFVEVHRDPERSCLKAEYQEKAKNAEEQEAIRNRLHIAQISEHGLKYI